MVACLLVSISILTLGHMAMWSIILVGLFNSVMFPSIFTLGIAELGPLTGDGSGLLIMAIVGGALNPLGARPTGRYDRPSPRIRLAGSLLLVHCLLRVQRVEACSGEATGLTERMEIGSSADRPGFIIGVDIGGTKVAAGLVAPGGEIRYHTRVPMAANSGPESGLASVTKSHRSGLRQGLKRRGVLQGIGICAPGPLDPNTGVILNPPNVPCWRNFPLADEISRKYNVPVKVDNDANAAALAEALWGAGRGFRNIFYATLGTGIGTGIVFDGHIYHGRTGAAGEGGHVSIDYRGPICACGKPGCIEVFASGPAIAKRAQALLSANRTHSPMLDEHGERQQRYHTNGGRSVCAGRSGGDGDLARDGSAFIALAGKHDRPARARRDYYRRRGRRHDETFP